MSLRAYLIIMSLGTAFSSLSWFLVAMNIDPTRTNRLGFFLFYFSLFVALLGFFALAGSVFRFVARHHVLAFQAVKEAFRQAFLLSSFILACLWLLAHGYFAWLNIVFLVIALSLMEFLLLGYSSKK